MAKCSWTAKLLALGLACVSLCGCGAILRETGYRLDSPAASYRVSGDGTAPSNGLSLLGGALSVNVLVEEHDLKVATMGPIIPIIPVFKNEQGLGGDRLTLVMEFTSDEGAEFDPDGITLVWSDGSPWSEQSRQVTDPHPGEDGTFGVVVVIVADPRYADGRSEGFRLTLPRIRVGDHVQDEIDLRLSLDSGWRYRISY